MAARIFLIIAIGMASLVPPVSAQAANASQNSVAMEKAKTLLETMSPEEKVGQLFLVTFQGTQTGEDSNIYKLITEQHVGGVVLRADNDNFAGADETVMAAHDTIMSLQQLNWQYGYSGKGQNASGTQQADHYVPLFVGITQEGDLAPYDQILNGLTILPNEMAIGATWDPQNAETVGSILGAELKTLGINLVFGPSLDVLDVVNTDVGEDLGVRSFGGDPYWVAEMGQAYIKGVHNGSNNKIAVIAKHFPGRGESDRQPEDEVATVRKSLEQLKQIELAPFFAVTNQTNDPQEIAEGLLLSHIRYQGFQGNIRATTRPVSFDATALNQLMGLAEFSNWQDSGGVLVSDDLGSAAVKKFFDPSNTGFDARQVIRNALLAGNDLLYTGNIVATGDVDTYSTIVRTHEYFVQKYNEDSAFKQRVDEAVLRVLTLKYKLYPTFSYSLVVSPLFNLDSLGKSDQKIFEIARQSVTLVSPELTDIDSVLAEPPQSNERIVFISDLVPQRQCSTCPEQNVFLADNLRKAVERLYGPGAGEQIQNYRLSAYTFENLNQLLDNSEAPEFMNSDLTTANWIVISFTDFHRSSEDAILFRRLFSEKPELTRNKKIIGFAFNAPYYLDATDISKFTAYYAVYSKIPVFVDVAARILFQEITPTGVLPVSVTSVGYDLITATTPDPGQIIPLMVDEEALSDDAGENGEIDAGEALIFKEGDSIPLTTGVILDHNGNKVPDGTVVRFIMSTPTNIGTSEQIETQTRDGVAKTIYRLQTSGQYTIRVTADPAITSQILSLDITNSGGLITSIEPTFAPTGLSATQIVSEPVEIDENTELGNHEQGFLTVWDWILSSLLVFLAAGSFYWWGWKRQKFAWNPRVPFAASVTGFAVYILCASESLSSQRSLSNTAAGLSC
jgi:beta-N-acetylhexosaminidase